MFRREATIEADSRSDNIETIKSGVYPCRIALKVRLEVAKRLETTRELLIEHADVWRQQTMEIEHVPLSLGEGCTLVQEGISEEVVAGERRRDGR